MRGKRQEVGELITQITQDQRFKQEVRRYMEENRQSEPNSDGLTFAFEKAAKYPWSAEVERLPVEGQKMVEDICDLMGNIIDHQLHEVLNREFVSISNQLLVMRDQLTEFTQRNEERTTQLKESLGKQMEQLKAKVIVNQGTSKEKQFVRTRASGIINSSASSMISERQRRSDLKAEIDVIRKQMQQLQMQSGVPQIIESLNREIVYVKDRLQNDSMDTRLKIEGVKQRSEKGLEQLKVRLKEQSGREYISGQVQRAVKSHFKVYLEEIGNLKRQSNELEEHINKTGKGLEQYIGNQLKAIWVMITNFKRRQEELQNSMNLNNQSFVLE